MVRPNVVRKAAHCKYSRISRLAAVAVHSHFLMHNQWAFSWLLRRSSVCQMNWAAIHCCTFMVDSPAYSGHSMSWDNPLCDRLGDQCSTFGLGDWATSVVALVCHMGQPNRRQMGKGCKSTGFAMDCQDIALCVNRTGRPVLLHWFVTWDNPIDARWARGANPLVSQWYAPLAPRGFWH